jgi:hypothetical protein
VIDRFAAVGDGGGRHLGADEVPASSAGQRSPIDACGDGSATELTIWL